MLGTINRMFRDRNWRLYKTDMKWSLDRTLKEGIAEELKPGMMYLPVPAVVSDSPETAMGELNRIFYATRGNPLFVAQHRMLEIDGRIYPLDMPERLAENSVLMMRVDAKPRQGRPYGNTTTPVDEIPYKKYIESLSRLPRFPDKILWGA